MKSSCYLALVLLVVLRMNGDAGEELSEGLLSESRAVDLVEERDWWTPSLDLRARYEFRNADPFEDSQAFTTRARFGIMTREIAGFSAFGELEATQALIDDYRSNPVDDSTEPFVLNNTVIGDPENFELNQGWLQYEWAGFRARLGRQRIIRNNAAYVANVGWRQNEQTYDALDLEYGAGPYRFSYAYSNRALTVFGDDANDAPPGASLRDYEGDFHFLDAQYKSSAFTAGVYAYLIDVKNNRAVGRSDSFGSYLQSGPMRLEMAFQTGESSIAAGGDYGAWYSHLSLTKTFGEADYSIGIEYLQNHFKTPFALLHAFNGFADVFVMQRAGLNDAGGAYEGLTDLYCGYVRPGLPFGLTFKGYLHGFFDDHVGETYGYEADAVLEKKFNENFTGILKAARFVGEGSGGFRDVTQVTAEMNFKF